VGDFPAYSEPLSITNRRNSPQDVSLLTTPMCIRYTFVSAYSIYFAPRVLSLLFLADNSRWHSHVLFYMQNMSLDHKTHQFSTEYDMNVSLFSCCKPDLCQHKHHNKHSCILSYTRDFVGSLLVINRQLAPHAQCTFAWKLTSQLAEYCCMR
jgi:hypothetical protein